MSRAERSDDRNVPTLEEALVRSMNLAFIWIMRDKCRSAADSYRIASTAGHKR
jgi:hypothetical protein